MLKELDEYRNYIRQTTWLEAGKQNDGMLNNIEREWLLTKGSLTAKLKERCTEFSVEVINQQYKSDIAENLVPFFDVGGEYLEREVWLKGDNEKWVYAITQIPQRTYSYFSQLTTLEEQPLGELIFKLPLQRKKLFFSCEKWPARCNLYYLENELPLLVTELFIRNTKLMS